MWVFFAPASVTEAAEAPVASAFEPDGVELRGVAMYNGT